MSHSSSPKEFPEIISIGGAALDLFIRAPHAIIEREGQRFLEYPLGAKIKIENVTQTCGGGATNTSVGFARLGIKAGFCGIVGDDSWGQEILRTLHKEGVDTETAIIIENEVSSFSLVLVDAHSGERTILYCPNVNAHLCDPIFPKERLQQSRWIFLNHLTDVSCVILDDLAEIVLSPELSIAWNPGGSQIRDGFDAPVVRDLLRSTDILFLNAEEAKEFFRTQHVQEAMEIALCAGVRRICVTDGKRGASCTDGTVSITADALPDVKVVDATGAGDAFAVGCTWAVLRGLSLQEMLTAGMINAANVLSFVGTQAGLLHEAELKTHLSHTKLHVR